jgi:hypothetical protein
MEPDECAARRGRREIGMRLGTTFTRSTAAIIVVVGMPEGDAQTFSKRPTVCESFDSRRKSHLGECMGLGHSISSKLRTGRGSLP